MSFKEVVTVIFDKLKDKYDEQLAKAIITFEKEEAQKALEESEDE